MKQEELVEAARHIVEIYYGRNDFAKSRLFSKELLVIGNNVLKGEQARTCRVVHRHYRITFQDEQIAVAIGTFRLLPVSEAAMSRERMCIASMVLSCQENKIEAVMLHISEKVSGKKYRLEDAQEHCYLMDEMDVFYLEAGHNRTKWHCRDRMIETTGTLKSTEADLSESFVRIHRGFIVNRYHVRKIARCYVELDNGVQLQIPVKKYMAVKEQLKKL